MAGFAAARGWAPAGDRPFDGHLEDAVAEINRTMHGAARALGEMRLHGLRVGATTFGDAYRGSIGGRAVIVANAWTTIGPEVRGAAGTMCGAAVCAVELPSILPIMYVQPRLFPPIAHVRESPVGNPAFDGRFLVAGTPAAGSAQGVLTPEVQQRIMGPDDWVFRAERYLLGCVSKGPFRSADEVTQRIGEVLGTWRRSPPRSCPITWTIPGTT